MTLRLLHCIHSLDPSGGGPAHFIRQMLEAQSNLGLPVDAEVLTLDCPDASHLNSYPAKINALGPGFSNYGYTDKWRPWLQERRLQYDLVVVHGLWQYASFGTYQALAGTNTPYVVFPHGMLDPWFNRAYPLKRIKKALYWPWAEQKVLKAARTVIFTAEDERDRARLSFHPYECNEAVSSLGTQKPPGDKQAQVAGFLDRFPELKNKRILLFLGRIHEKKGVDMLISAFAAGRFDPSWQLVLAGPLSGNFQATIKNLCAPLAGRVTFTGMLDGELKWGALRAAEVLALPSHQENFALSVSEALSCSTPVLISRQVNTWRYIEGDGAGLVESDDLPGTQRLLERWRDMDLEDRLRMAANAAQCFRNRFDIDTAAPSMIRLFESCARKRDGIYDV